MVEERIVTVDPHEAGSTHTTIVTDGGRRGGSGWLIAIVLIVALVAGILIFGQMSGSETAKDNAIAGAASEVGDAAQQVGNAAQDAANSLNK